jgi:proline-rich protein PRCC
MNNHKSPAACQVPVQKKWPNARTLPPAHERVHTADDSGSNPNPTRTTPPPSSRPLRPRVRHREFAMDSLLASYASSDDEADEAPPAPATTPAAARGGEAGAKPAASSSSSIGGGIFSSLPQPKSAPLFSSLPAPKSGPTFSAIPPPKSSGNPKRVVQYRPQPIRQPTGDSSDEEEDEAKKRCAKASEAPPAVSAGSGPVSSFLPPPKHSLGLGAGAGVGARRSAIGTAAPERASLGAAVPASSVANTGAPEKAETGADDDEDSEDSGSEEDMPVPDQQDDVEQLGSDAGAGQQQQQGYDTGVGQPQHPGYDAGAGSTSGYEAYAWDPNYYAQYGANYVWDPNGNVNYATGEQYAAYGGEHGGGYAHPHGGEHVGGYANVAVASYGADCTGGYGHEAAAATTFPPMQDPVLPPAMGRIGGKRGRNDMPTEIVEVNQEELMKNRPKQDTSKLTGLAFGPSYQVQILHFRLTLCGKNCCQRIMLAQFCLQ